MASRPRLEPYFRPLRRGPDAVQLGLTAASGGVVLRGLGPAEIAFLAGLDGTLTETELGSDAATRGIAPERAVALVELLREHHLLDGDLDGAGPDRVDLGRLPGAPLALARLGVGDAPVRWPPASGTTSGSTSPWRPRSASTGAETPPVGPVVAVKPRGTGETDGTDVVPEVGADIEFFATPDDRATGGTRQLLHRTAWRVVVSGCGRLPWAIGSLLRTTGVGQVDLGPAAVHALDQAMRSDPSTDAPDLVVLVGSRVLDPRIGDPWWRRGVPTLPVVTDGRRIVVGPVVGDRAGPCLHCLDLERADRDTAWPALAAQVSALGGSAVDAESSTESMLTAMASGVVAMIVTAHLAGDRPPGGVSVEMSLPWPRLDHRRWVRHARCARHPGARHTGPGATGSGAGRVPAGRQWTRE